MDTSSSPHKGDAGNEQALSEEVRKVIPPNLDEINIADGGEFLDDGIRMKDQPFGETTIPNQKN